MEWSFEFSFMMFLIIVFLSYAIEIRTKSRLSLPFALGIICIIGFGTGLFPKNFIVQSKMKEIGVIAFNMLVIHSGTMIDFKAIKSQKKNILIAVGGVVIMSAVVIWGVGPIIGREFAAMSPGPLVGGGAAAAISSISMLRVDPGIAVFPWLIFMAQCFFCVPFCSFLIKKESQLILDGYRKGSKNKVSGNIQSAVTNEEQIKLCDRIPAKYKTTAYYLGTLMIVSVFNRWLSVSFFMEFGININITALIFGILMGSLGILERGPLIKSNTMSFLMLGLMALMVDTLASTSLSVLSSLIIPLIIVCTIGAVILILVGVTTSKICKFSLYKGIIITLNSMVGFPVNLQLVEETANKLATDNEEKQLLKGTLNPILSAGSTVIVNIVSILLASMVLFFV